MFTPEFKAQEIAKQAACIKIARNREAFIELLCGEDESLRSRVTDCLSKAPQEEEQIGDDDWALAGGFDFIWQEGNLIGQRYQLLGKIGSGGFGEVWKAKDCSAYGGHVAVKVVRYGSDPGRMRARLEIEREALTRLSHPNIAKLLDAGTLGECAYFVIEYVEGGLRITDYCEAHSLGLDQRLELFFQVCAAVQHADSKAIIHRDIKPANVLVQRVNDQPVVKVIDFGVAKFDDRPGITRMGSMIGTPEYMSPEQAEGTDDVDKRMDIYGLGALLYEMLTTRPPFSSDDVSWLLTPEDLPQSPRLMARLREAKDPLAAHLWERLDAGMRQALTAEGAVAAEQKAVLVGGLNQVLLGECMYLPARFTGIALGEDVTALLEKKPRGKALVRLNRLLLETAFPGQIRKKETTLKDDICKLIRTKERKPLPLRARLEQIEEEYPRLGKQGIGSWQGKRWRPELEWIVMKCLAWRREDRYESAEALAADVRHYLTRQPLNREPRGAGPPTRWYAAKRFVRHHWKTVTITSSFLGVLLLATGVSLAQYRRATSEREVAIEARQRVLATLRAFREQLFEKAMPKVAGAEGREVSLRDSVALAIERLNDDKATAVSKYQPSIRASLLNVLGDAQIFLENTEDAITCYSNALAICDTTPEMPAEVIALSRLSLASALMSLGLESNAYPHLNLVERLGERALLSAEDSWRLQASLARYCAVQGLEGKALYHVQMLSRLAHPHTDFPLEFAWLSLIRLHSLTYTNVGDVVERALNSYASATYRRRSAFLELELVASSLASRRLTNAAVLLRRQGLTMLDQALRSGDKRFIFAFYHAMSLSSAKREAEGYAAARKAYAESENLRDGQGNEPVFWASKLMFASFLLEQGNQEEALTLLEEVAAFQEEKDLAMFSSFACAWHLWNQAEHEKSLTYLGNAISLLEEVDKTVPEFLNMLRPFEELGFACARDGRYADAQAIFSKIAVGYRLTKETGDAELVGVMRGFVDRNIGVNWGSVALGCKVIVEELRSLFPDTHVETCILWSRARLALNEIEAAERLLSMVKEEERKNSATYGADRPLPTIEMDYGPNKRWIEARSWMAAQPTIRLQIGLQEVRIRCARKEFKAAEDILYKTMSNGNFQKLESYSRSQIEMEAGQVAVELYNKWGQQSETNKWDRFLEGLKSSISK